MNRLISITRFLALAIVCTLSTLVPASSAPVAASGPIKQWSGIHLGNRPAADWTPDLLARIDGDQPGGIWPKAVIFLSSQLYNMGVIRADPPDCRINMDPSTWTQEMKDNFIGTGRLTQLRYLHRASQAGVRIIIRIHHSPGNFEDSTPNDHRLQLTAIDNDYCRWNGDNWWANYHRSPDDLADEIVAIHRYNRIINIQGEDLAFNEWGFEPANEPNTEWYNSDPNDNIPDTSPNRTWVEAWQDMQAYFTEIRNSVRSRVPTGIRVLTPPMAQSAHAETKQVNAINDPDPSNWCPDMRLRDDRSTGYGVMQEYYTTNNDGIDWHNYWRLGFEWSGACSIGAQHVSYFFPDWMQNVLKPLGEKDGTVTEADLFSSGGPPNQDPNQPLQDKDDRGGWPAANSLRKFFYNEFRSDTIVAWLLNDNVNDPNQDHNWHEAYDDQQGNAEQAWFTQWWPNFEHWTPPVYLADVRSGDAGWDSEILIQNVTGWYPDMTIDLFEDNGTHAGHYTCPHLDPKATCVVNPTNTGFNGWAVVSAEWGVVVAALTRNGYELTAYNGILPDDVNIGDPGWERAGITLYAPMIKRSHSGRSSQIYVLNAGPGPATVTVDYYHKDHTGVVGTHSHDLGPGQRWLFLPSDVIDTGYVTDTLFSAVITSDADSLSVQDDQPLATLVMEYADDLGQSNRATHNVFRQGALKLFAPVVKDNWSGQNSGLSIQNVADTGLAKVQAEFYDYTDGSSEGAFLDWVWPKKSTVFYVPALDFPPPDTFSLGTAEVRSVAPYDEDIAGMVHEAGNGRFMTHVMATAGSQTVYMPRQGQWSDASQVEWTVAAMIMNAGSQATDVTVRFYKENGDPDTGRDFTVQSLASHAAFSTWANVAGFKGSAVATSSGEPIVAAINYVNNAALGDTGASFNAPNR